MVEGVLQPTNEGAPQGGPLSPLLSNILLDDFDKALEHRRLKFVRYADDFVIFVRSQRSAVRVFASVQRYLTQHLKLVVNEQKSSVRPARGCEFLGFAFVGKRVTITAAPKKLQTFKRRIKELTGRSRGISMERRLTDLNRYVRGWTWRSNMRSVARATGGCHAHPPCATRCLTSGWSNWDCFRSNNSGATSLRFEEPPDADPHVRWCGEGHRQRWPQPDLSDERGTTRQRKRRWCIRLFSDMHYNTVVHQQKDTKCQQFPLENR